MERKSRNQQDPGELHVEQVILVRYLTRCKYKCLSLVEVINFLNISNGKLIHEYGMKFFLQ